MAAHGDESCALSLQRFLSHTAALRISSQDLDLVHAVIGGCPGALVVLFGQEFGKAEWVVYAKQPFTGPEQVLRYLSRYTHRVAISNRRLVSSDDRRRCVQVEGLSDPKGPAATKR